MCTLGIKQSSDVMVHRGKDAIITILYIDGVTRSILYVEQFFPTITKHKEDALCIYNYLVFNITAYPLPEFRERQERKHDYLPNCSSWPSSDGPN